MQIRFMQMDDYDAAVQLWKQIEGLRLTAADDSEIGLRRYLTRNPNTCFVAVDEDKIIGTILSGHDGRRGYIYHMAVAPAYQKQGVGKALLQSALSALKTEGIGKAALVALNSNLTGNAWWNKQGFAARNDLIYRDFVIGE